MRLRHGRVSRAAGQGIIHQAGRPGEARRTPAGAHPVEAAVGEHRIAAVAAAVVVPTAVEAVAVGAVAVVATAAAVVEAAVAAISD
jgi:hypothetical protein